MEMLGLSLGIVSVFAVLVTNRWTTFQIVSVCIAVAFVGLWIGTNPSACGDTGTEIQLAMCHQSHSASNALRMLTQGLPGLVVLVVWGFKFKRLNGQRADERRFANPGA
jgi:hypothetical protein